MKRLMQWLTVLDVFAHFIIYQGERSWMTSRGITESAITLYIVKVHDKIVTPFTHTYTYLIRTDMTMLFSI